MRGDTESFYPSHWSILAEILEAKTLFIRPIFATKVLDIKV